MSIGGGVEVGGNCDGAQPCRQVSTQALLVAGLGKVTSPGINSRQIRGFSLRLGIRSKNFDLHTLYIQ